MVESAGDWLLQVGDGVPGRKQWLQHDQVIRLTESGVRIVFDPAGSTPLSQPKARDAVPVSTAKGKVSSLSRSGISPPRPSQPKPPPLPPTLGRTTEPVLPPWPPNQVDPRDPPVSAASSPAWNDETVRMRVELPEASAAANGAPWYYALNGRRLGPVSNEDITRLLAQSTISNESLVWTAGFADWLPIARTTLRKPLTEPPPLTGCAVNNTFVWIVAFAPIIGTFLEYLVAGATHSNRNSLWFITLALNIVLTATDDWMLKQAGHDTKKWGWMWWLVPVYLYKRAKALNQSLAYFTTWMICFFVSLFL